MDIRSYLLAFIPIFVAVDALGLLPLYSGLTRHLEESERRRVVVVSIITAFTLAVAFLFLGRAVFAFLGITVGDFMVAGGAILFALALREILQTGRSRHPDKDVGAVPLGTPLITGPAVLTTTLILADQYGVLPTLVSLVLNIFLAGLVLHFSKWLIGLLGESGAKAASKVAHLLLGAIGVMMVRKGFMLLVNLPR